MATKIYLHRGTTALGGTLPAASTSVSANTPTKIATGGDTNRVADQTIGASAQTSNALTTNADTNIQSALMVRCIFNYPLAAQTLGGTASNISLEAGGSESNANSNFAVSAIIAVWRPGTGSVVGRVTDGASLSQIGEVGTSQTVATAFSGNNTSVTAQEGDYLVIELWRVAASQSMGTAYTNTLFYDGTTENSTTNEAAFINFGNNITFINFGSGQAQASIKVIKQNFAQSQVLISGSYNSVTDTFTRTVSSGLGTNDTGDSYTVLSGLASNLNVDGAVATLAAGDSHIDGLSRTLIEIIPNSTAALISFQYKISALPGATIEISANIGLGAAKYYGSSSINDTGTIGVGIRISSAGSITLMYRRGASVATTGTIGTIGVNELWNFKGIINVGASNVFETSKTWKVGNAEPTDWQGSQKDTITSSLYLFSGFPDIQWFTNGQITTLDNLSISKTVLSGSGQAQAKIGGTVITSQVAQAQADIKAKNTGLSQAQAQIKREAVNNEIVIQNIYDTSTTGAGPLTLNIATALDKNVRVLVITTDVVTDITAVSGGGKAWTKLGEAAQTNVGSEIWVSRQLDASNANQITITYSGTPPLGIIATYYELTNVRQVTFEYNSQTGIANNIAQFIDTVFSELQRQALHLGSFITDSSFLYDTGTLTSGYTTYKANQVNQTDEIFIYKIWTTVDVGGADPGLVQVTYGDTANHQWIAQGIFVYQVPMQFAQTQAFIRKSAGRGQANADIKAKGNGLGQSQADIKAKGNGLGQALAQISTFYQKNLNREAGLVSYWRLGDASGTLVSDYEGPNIGTLVGSPTLGVTGTITGDPNTAITLNGSTQYISVADSTSLNIADVGSFETWLMLGDRTVGNTQIIRRGGTGAYSFGYSGDAASGGNLANAIFLARTTSGVIASSNTTITDTTTYHHVIATKNGSTIHFYIDGVDAGTTVITPQTWVDVSGVALNIGRNQANSEYFNGTLDEVAIYSVEVSQEQAFTHYTLGKIGSVIRSGQAQAKITVGVTTVSQTGQAQADIKAINNGLGQSQTDIKAIGNGLGQAQSDIKTQGFGLGQAQTDIKTQNRGFGQSQADIKAIGNGLGQVQGDIKATGFGLGQSQADIKATGNGLGQAQSDIKATNFGLGQSQADIKTQNRGFGQSQADIKAIGNGLGQANSDIKAIGYGSGQAQSDIKVTANGSGQAQTSVKGNAFAQSQADIKATGNGLGQSQADIKASGFGLGQSQADIKTNGYGLGQSQADIKAKGNGLAQANADIKAVGNGLGQANADIKATSNQFAQAQTDIKTTYSQFAQAQADIKVTQTGSGQAQSDIKVTTRQFAQAQADIKTTYYGSGQAQCTVVGNAFGQSQADIKQTYWGLGQAQADIKTKNNGSGQANAAILGAVQQFGQAQADILTGGYASAQSQADIKQLGNAFGQSQADIRHTYTGSGQAQTSIVGNAFAQAQTDIKTTYVQSAQANADIKAVNSGFGQSQTDIKTTQRGFAQAQSDIKVVTVNCAQANTDIKTTYTASGQANADIKVTSNGSGQAQCAVKGNAFAQANADIKATLSGSGQAQVTIVGNAFAQAQADIKTKNNGFGQAQCTILSGKTGVGQAQADIKAVEQSFGQAQTDILAKTNQFAQANSDIKQIGLQSAQAQGLIIQIYLGTGQANADIKTQGYGAGQTQTDIKTTANRFAQAQADIKAVGFGNGQANTYIKLINYSFAQSQTDIRTTYSQSAQAQTDIQVRTSQSANAQATIRINVNNSAQAEATIKATNSSFGQAQTYITSGSFGTGLAQASISASTYGSGQAEAQIIKSAGYGQAAARIIQAHTLKRLIISDRIILQLNMVDREFEESTVDTSSIELVLSDRVRRVVI